MDLVNVLRSSPSSILLFDVLDVFVHPLATQTTHAVDKLINTTIETTRNHKTREIPKEYERKARNMAAIDFTSGYVSPKLEIESNGKSFSLRLLTMNCWLVD